jgi:uncharacterized membrane protein YccC
VVIRASNATYDEVGAGLKWSPAAMAALGERRDVASAVVRQKVAASRGVLTAPRHAITAGVERRRARPRSILVVRSGIAAALAYLVAVWFGFSDAPVLAPLTAVLVVQTTLSETFVHGLQRFASVLTGVVLATLISSVAGMSAWSLGLLVVASLAAGKLLRLGPNVVEVPVSAMIILAVHGSADQVSLRIGETLVGSLVGVVANLVLLPPVFLEPSVRAVRDLAAQTQELLLLMSFGLRDGWSAERAGTWLAGARALSERGGAARTVLEKGEQSARFNPRGRHVRSAWGELDKALEGQRQVIQALRGVCRGLVDRNRADGAGRLHDAARLALADTLDPISDAVHLVAPWLIDGPGDPAARPELAHMLREARSARDTLRSALVADAVETPRLWQANGALLALLDQLLREIDDVAASRRLAAPDDIVLT